MCSYVSVGLSPQGHSTCAKHTADTGVHNDAQARYACRPSTQKRALSQPVDIVVSTPQQVVVQMRAGNLAIGDVQFLVIDEADTMFEGGFAGDLEAVIAPLVARRGAPPLAGVLVSATMSRDVQRLAERAFPGVVKAETSTLHRGIRGSNHVFVPLPPGQDKLDMLFQVRLLRPQSRLWVLYPATTLGRCRGVFCTCVVWLV